MTSSLAERLRHAADHPPERDCPECQKHKETLLAAMKLDVSMRISAIITALNEGDEVLPTLFSLRDAGANEVILVDDGSTDGSCAREKIPAWVILIRNEKAEGVGTARCQGIAMATGNVLALFDAHVRLTPGSLRQPCAMALHSHAIICLTVEPLGDEKHAKIGAGFGARLQLHPDASHFTTQYHTAAPKQRFSPIAGPIGAAYIVAREELERIGGWFPFPSYGGDEQALALQAWFTDTPVLVDRDCRSWHRFGSAHAYLSLKTTQYLNFLLAAFCHFEERTFRTFWLPNVAFAWREAGEQWPALEKAEWVQQRRADFQKRKKHTDLEFARWVGDKRLLPFVASDLPPPMVSVMMPAHNCGPTIAQAIRSVQAQTWTNWDLVIVDDASTDNTLAIAQGFAANDGRIRIRREPEKVNCPMARNDALKMCRGDFIARLDADDWDEPTRLEKSVRYLMEHPGIHVVSCRMIEHLAGGKPEGKISDYSPVCGSMVARREVYEQIKFREFLDAGSDAAWNLDVQAAGLAFGEIPEPLYHYRRGRPGSISLTRAKATHFAALPKTYLTRDGCDPARLRHLKLRIPDLFDYGTVLYIGANKTRHELVPSFCLAGYSMDVLEIHDPYLTELRELNANRKYFRRIIPGDVRDLTALAKGERYDVVMWWHGPEHVEPGELAAILPQLEAAARKVAVIGSPHGEMAQAAIDDNEHQRHRWAPMPEGFRALGWQTDTTWPNPNPGSHLIAWRRHV